MRVTSPTLETINLYSVDFCKWTLLLINEKASLRNKKFVYMPFLKCEMYHIDYKPKK